MSKSALTIFFLVLFVSVFYSQKSVNETETLASFAEKWILIKTKIIPIFREHSNNPKVREIINDLGKADPQLKEAILRGESDSVLFKHFSDLYRNNPFISDSSSGLTVQFTTYIQRTAQKGEIWFNKREYDKGNVETELDFWSRNDHWVKTVLWLIVAIVAILWATSFRK